MSIRPDLVADVNALTGDTALPRSNGELTFDQPWEARAFSLAVALCEAGRYEWNGFRDRLIEAVAERAPDDGSHYYESWLLALESVVVERGLLERIEILDRVAAIREQDSHTDHGHDDDHDHPHHVHR